MACALCNVGGVAKCRPFLKQEPLENDFQGSGCFQFPEAVIIYSKRKPTLYQMGLLQVLAVLQE